MARNRLIALAAASFLLPAGVALAQDEATGQARAVAPDSLAIGGTRFRLAGVEGVPQGEVALQALVGAGTVTCSRERRFGHGVYEGRCRLADGSDVSLRLLRGGFGRATARARTEYKAAEAEARAAGRGVWQR